MQMKTNTETTAAKRSGGNLIRTMAPIAMLLLGSATALGQTHYQQIMVLGSPSMGGVGSIRPLVWAEPDVLCGTTTRDSWASTTNWLFSLRTDGSAHSKLHLISHTPTVSSGLAVGADGAIFGMNTGYVFRWNRDGSLKVLLDSETSGFQGPLLLGYAVTIGPDGTLFGTAESGNNPNGAVFKINPDGSALQIIHNFTGGPSDGDKPDGGLIVGSDGALYGVTLRGGIPDALGHFLGTVFRLNQDGSGYRVLHNFAGYDGAFPKSALIQGRDGMLYGTTEGGGPLEGGGGLVFKLNTDGSSFTVIYSFPKSDASEPPIPSALIQGPDGALYGTTQYGGLITTNQPEGLGTVFRLNTDGSAYTTLRRFSGEDGRNPQCALLAGPEGSLYGTTVYGGYFDQGTVFKLTASPTETASLIDFYPTPTGFAVTLSAPPGQTWVLQSSTDLGRNDPWHAVATLQTDAFGLARVTDASGPGFYRATKP